MINLLILVEFLFKNCVTVNFLVLLYLLQFETCLEQGFEKFHIFQNNMRKIVILINNMQMISKKFITIQCSF